MVMLDVMLTVATAMTTTTMTMMTVASMLTMMMIAHVPMMTTTINMMDGGWLISSGIAEPMTRMAYDV